MIVRKYRGWNKLLTFRPGPRGVFILDLWNESSVSLNMIEICMAFKGSAHTVDEGSLVVGISCSLIFGIWYLVWYGGYFLFIDIWYLVFGMVW